MDLGAGPHSPGGDWYWDGERWIAAVSPDGQWWWDGAQWVERSVPQRRTTLVPTWDRSDALRLLAAAFLVPAFLAMLFGVLVWTDTEDPVTWGVVLAIGLIASGAVVGFGVRSSSGWHEVFVLALTIAIAIAAFSGVAGVLTTDLTDPCNRPANEYRSECDTTGYGIGAAAIGASCLIVLVPSVAAGKALSRRRKRSAPR
jgi:hypothetical protein